MKRYTLLRDLPTFKAGEEFFISESGNLIAGTPDNPKQITVETEYGIPMKIDLMAYAQETLEEFPNILKNWFEEVKDSEGHFYIDSRGKIEYTHSNWDKGMLQLRKLIGNHFETEEEAEERLAYLKAKEVIKGDTNGFLPDWNDESQLKFSVSYDYKNRKMMYNQSDMIEHIPIYFSNQTALRDSLLKHKEEWMKLFIGE